MKQTWTARTSVEVHAPVEKVWDALVNPAMIRQYFFGVQVISDWKEGSPITYKGVWEGKEFVDKGTILRIVPHELLSTNYWTSFSGLEDKPENYQNVAYALTARDGVTVLTVTQDRIPDETSKQHSEQNWKSVLESLKKLVEKQ